MNKTRPNESTKGEKIPLGACSSSSKRVEVGSSRQSPVTTGALSYSSSCGYKCASPLRGRSDVKRMRSSLAAYKGEMLL